MTAKIVDFRREGWRDAIAVLRGLVERLESGEEAPILLGALVTYGEDGSLTTYAFGPQGDDLKALALLELGKVRITDVLMGA